MRMHMHMCMHMHMHMCMCMCMCAHVHVYTRRLMNMKPEIHSQGHNFKLEGEGLPSIERRALGSRIREVFRKAPSLQM